MEIRRMRAALDLIERDSAKLKIKKKLENLHTTAQNLIASPTDAATNDAFLKAAEDAKTALAEAEANTAPSSIRLALKEINLHTLVGENILAELNEILGAT